MAPGAHLCRVWHQPLSVGTLRVVQGLDGTQSRASRRLEFDQAQRVSAVRDDAEVAADAEPYSVAASAGAQERVKDEEAVLVCSPTRGRARAAVPGSARRYCDRCGQEVFVAPSSLALMAQYRVVTFRCVPCVRREPPPRDKVARLTPEQLLEIFEAQRKEPC